MYDRAFAFLFTLDPCQSRQLEVLYYMPIVVAVRGNDGTTHYHFGNGEISGKFCYQKIVKSYMGQRNPLVYLIFVFKILGIRKIHKNINQ